MRAGWGEARQRAEVHLLDLILRCLVLEGLHPCLGHIVHHRKRCTWVQRGAERVRRRAERVRSTLHCVLWRGMIPLGW